VVLLQSGDTQIDLPELKGHIADMQWEGVWKQDGHFHAGVPDQQRVLPGVRGARRRLAAGRRQGQLEAHAESWVPYVKAPPF